MAKLILKSPYIKGNRGAGYLRYVATRDGVQKYLCYVDGRPKSQGLFTDACKSFTVAQAAREVSSHGGNTWTHIISLRRDDAERLGYDNVDAWADLLRRQRNAIAKQMHIKPENFRWYAAYHDDEVHPHVHLMAWSTKPGEAWLSTQGIERMKSALARDVFRDELLHIYEQQTAHRDDLRQAAKELVQQHANPAVENLLRQLAEQLRAHKGKKVYAFLSPEAKTTVNRIVDELAKDPHIAQLYDLWYEQREAVLATYASDMPERVALSENEVFKSVKNAVIAEAVKLQFEQRESAAQQNSTDNLALGSLRLLGQLARIIENDIDDMPAQVQTDSKLQLEIAKKKMDSGLKM